MTRLYLSFDKSICICFFVAYQYILHTGCTVQIHSSMAGAFGYAFYPGNSTSFCAVFWSESGVWKLLFESLEHMTLYNHYYYYNGVKLKKSVFNAKLVYKTILQYVLKHCDTYLHEPLSILYSILLARMSPEQEIARQIPALLHQQAKTTSF